MADDEKELAAARRLLRESAPKERYNWSENLARKKDAEEARKRAAEVLGQQQTAERSYEDDAPEEQKAEAVGEDKNYALKNPVSAALEKLGVMEAIQKRNASRSQEDKLSDAVLVSKWNQAKNNAEQFAIPKAQWARENIPGFSPVADIWKRGTERPQLAEDTKTRDPISIERTFSSEAEKQAYLQRLQEAAKASRGQ